jgi:hypothetical protein
MKKILLFASLLFMVIKTHSQEMMFQLGVSTEANFSTQNLTREYAEEFTRTPITNQSLASLGFGIDAAILFGNVSLNTGFKYTRRGSKLAFNLDVINPTPPVTNPIIDDTGNSRTVASGRQETVIEMTAFRVPLLLGYKFGEEGMIFDLRAGPAFYFGSGDVIEKTKRTFIDNNNLPITPQTAALAEDSGRQFYGSATNQRYNKPMTSLVINPNLSIQISDDGFLRLGAYYETFLSVVNPAYRPVNSPSGSRIEGVTQMNSFAIEIGYVHRFWLSGGVY